MCGRYINISTVEKIEKRFGAIFLNPDAYQQNVNIAVGEKAPVITSENPEAIQLFTFGFTPHWAYKQTYVANARSEGDHNRENDIQYKGTKGIVKKPLFRQAIRSQRCIVIADGFIQGPRDLKLSKPYLIYPSRNQGPVALAGVYDTWEHPLTGQLEHSFAIITTVANRLTSRISNHRSPVILKKEDEKKWLDGTLELDGVTEMLTTNKMKGWNAYPISSKIKKANNKNHELLKPMGKPIFKEFDYIVYNTLKKYGMGETPSRERKFLEGMQLFLF